MAHAPFAVIGAGSWGTALAMLLASNGHAVRLWSHEQDHVADMIRDGENRAFLPGLPLSPKISPSADLTACVRDIRHVLVVVPSHAFRHVLEAAKPALADDALLLWATKGLDPANGNLLHTVVDDVLGSDQPRAILSGPTFAGEVAAGHPTAMTVASPDEATAAALAGSLSNDYFRSYYTDDITGVEIGGSVKNVLAIGAGIIDGLGYGANARSAMVTRGLAEMMRLGDAMGARRDTFMGLAGLGDLMLTCTDNQSRNRRMGLALGGGQDMASARSAIGQEVEGIGTAREVHRLANRLKVDMPISEQVYRVLYEGLDPHQAVQELFSRELRAEGV